MLSLGLYKMKIRNEGEVGFFYCSCPCLQRMKNGVNKPWENKEQEDATNFGFAFHSMQVERAIFNGSQMGATLSPN